MESFVVVIFVIDIQFKAQVFIFCFKAFKAFKAPKKIIFLLSLKVHFLKSTTNSKEFFRNLKYDRMSEHSVCKQHLTSVAASGTRLEVEAERENGAYYSAAVRQLFPGLPTPTARALRLSLRVPIGLPPFCFILQVPYNRGGHIC